MAHHDWQREFTKMVENEKYKYRKLYRGQDKGNTSDFQYQITVARINNCDVT